MSKCDMQREKEDFVYGIAEGSALNNGGNYTMYSELSRNGDAIDHGYADLSFWFCGEDRFKGGVIWDDAPEGEIKRRFPFCKYVQVFSATGGEYAGNARSFINRDLYADPTDPEKGYNFAPLFRICDNIVRQGVKPYLKLGYVPPVLSDDFEPSLLFYTNLRPPTDFGRYYQYLKDIMEALAGRYGVEELRTWMWGSLTEIDNAAWFITADENMEHTAAAAIKMYECTVAAVESVLGEGKADIGPHFCFCYWSPELLLKHCAEEINPFTGKKGTTVRRIGISCYQTMPGDMEHQPENPWRRLKEYADKYGFRDIDYTFDEGDMIFGADGLNLITTTFAAQPWAVSKRALDFKKALDHNWRSFFSWGYTTFGGAGVWNDGMFKDSNLRGANYGFTNMYILAYKMFGSIRQAVAKGGNLLDKEDLVDAVIGYKPETRKLYVLVFNHNEDYYSTTAENFTVRIARAKLHGEPVAKKWVVDANHADFFRTWWEERGKNARYLQSVFDSTFPRALIDEEDKRFWEENEARYAEISTLSEPVEFKPELSGRQIVFRDTIADHGVILYELSEIEPEEVL